MGGMFSDLKKLERKTPAPVSKAGQPVNTATRTPVQPQSREHGNTAIREPVQSTVTPLDINDRAEVKQTYNCSANEAKAMRRLLWDLEEQHGLVTGKQDLQRSGIRMIVEDFKQNGEHSFIVRVLRNKR